MSAARLDGTVVAAFGRSHRVALDDGTVVQCVTRGRRAEIACGDRVEVVGTGPSQGVIEAVAPRASLLYRSDAHRQKLIAANVTRVVIVLAVWPSFYESLLNRCLVAAECAGVEALIVLNKTDLPGAETAAAALDLYRALGYPLLRIEARRDVTALRAALAGGLNVLVGQSGMGKSTIVNALAPEAAAATAEVSAALDSGRHTTTHARLYRVDADTRIIDSPGMQEFGLHHVGAAELDHGFVEFRPFIGGCRFANCRHRGEPGCAIDAAVAAGRVDARRLALYREIAAELARRPAR